LTARGAAEGFRGFGKVGLKFLADLAENNNREWFQAHREVYDTEIVAPMAAFIEALTLAFQVREVALTGDVKHSMFRIYRDVRFSKDKTPYKTNASCVLSRDGSKQGTGILYVQVGGTAAAFMALGFYGPEPDDLAALRQAIVQHPKRWSDVEASLEAAGLALSDEDSLVRMPRGFEAQAEAPFARVLRMRNLVVRRDIRPARVHSAGLVDDVVAFAREGAALLSFGRRAIDTGRKG
jgi:uncharacterized protein (TIGR02453 family)